MTHLHQIAGNAPILLRLLEAGGYQSVEELAVQSPDDLAARLTDAAARLGVPSVISREDAARLVARARTLVPAGAAAPPAANPPTSANSMAAPPPHSQPSAPAAVNLDDVPEAIAIPVAGAAPKQSAPKQSSPKQPSPKQPSPVPVRPVQQPANGAARSTAADLNDRARSATLPPKSAPKKAFRNFDAYVSGETPVEPLPRNPAADEEEVDGALKRFNYKPGEPIPRLVRRGVPHPRPYYLAFCAMIVLIFRALMLTVIIGTPIVLWPAFARGDKQPLFQFLWVIGGWLLTGLLYLCFTLRARCRVCTNQIFWSKRCFKNQRAHRVPGLGFVASLALHALLFGWFRCMYCGTAIRLKFVADPEKSK